MLLEHRVHSSRELLLACQRSLEQPLWHQGAHATHAASAPFQAPRVRHAGGVVVDAAQVAHQHLRDPVEPVLGIVL